MRITAHLEDTLQFMVQDDGKESWKSASAIAGTEAFSLYMRSLSSQQRESIQLAMIASSINVYSDSESSEDILASQDYRFTLEQQTDKTPSPGTLFEFSDSGNSSLERFLNNKESTKPSHPAHINHRSTLTYSVSRSSSVSSEEVEQPAIPTIANNLPNWYHRDSSLSLDGTSDEHTQPKRGPGRPKKQLNTRFSPKRSITEDIVMTTDITPKRGRGRPRKNENIQVVEKPSTSPKRGRGRPRKSPKPSIEPLAVSTPKRGPGRPRIYPKQSTPEKSLISPKRGPGRPRKSPKQSTPEECTPKRGRGRSRKSENTEIIEKSSPSPKRGRGRPRKNKNSEAVEKLSTSPKRGRGRPRKKPITEDGDNELASPKRGRGRTRKDSLRSITEEISTVESSPKRGRGRPRNVSNTHSVGNEAKNTSAPKRGVGRLRKSPRSKSNGHRSQKISDKYESDSRDVELSDVVVRVLEPVSETKGKGSSKRRSAPPVPDTLSDANFLDVSITPALVSPSHGKDITPLFINGSILGKRDTDSKSPHHKVRCVSPVRVNVTKISTKDLEKQLPHVVVKIAPI